MAIIPIFMLSLGIVFKLIGIVCGYILHLNLPNITHQGTLSLLLILILHSNIIQLKKEMSTSYHEPHHCRGLSKGGHLPLQGSFLLRVL